MPDTAENKYSHKEHWNDLIKGSFTALEIADSVANEEWQVLRKHLKGKPLVYRHIQLGTFLNIHKNAFWACCCVTNYVNALARGGMIK